uniref:Reverse transcriptase domain-containing protein n=1 Tax=Amphimedon queenslandica TaxID=400682 RepID=A0A1X7USQ8_AMPQE
MVLHGLEFAYVYIDDVLVASSYQVEHKNDLIQIINRFKEYGVFIYPEKCEFGQCSLHFLDIWPMRMSQRLLKQFLRLINFYHRFLPHRSQTPQPLYSSLSSTPARSPISWTDDLVNVFYKAKSALGEATYVSS